MDFHIQSIYFPERIFKVGLFHEAEYFRSRFFQRKEIQSRPLQVELSNWGYFPVTTSKRGKLKCSRNLQRFNPNDKQRPALYGNAILKIHESLKTLSS